MLPPTDTIVTVGRGSRLVLIHGTATDGGSWSPLARLLEDRARVTVYDRRGTPGWPVDSEQIPGSVEEHARDLADLIGRLGSPVHLCGASFGAMVALEMCRTYPSLLRKAALFEPPVTDKTARFTRALLAQFDRLLREGKPREASERFHRGVLGDAFWERLAPPDQERARRLGPHIHGDLRAQNAYRVSCEALQEIDIPVLLLRGEQTENALEAALNALANALSQSRQGVLKGAGHQITGAAFVEMAHALTDFMDL